MSYGIFLGYKMLPGGKWSGQYYVRDLTDFVGHSLRIEARPESFRIFPHVTEQVRMPKRGGVLSSQTEM